MSLFPWILGGGAAWYLLKRRKAPNPNVSESVPLGNGYVMNVIPPPPGTDPRQFEGKTIWALIAPNGTGIKSGVAPTRAQAIEDARQVKLQDEIAKARG